MNNLKTLQSVCRSYDDRQFPITPSGPTITTPLGKVRGYWKTSAKGEKFAAFEGIPYAKPPIGKRRFEAAEPVEQWKGIWDANFLVKCAQTDLIQTEMIQGEEDCLYLNIYVPRENPTRKDKLDVIVHIHGGAFMSGSGHYYSHPEYLMDEDVVFVSFNYRLGILGFLSTEDDVVPGNNGMKDQVLALKWVQKYITFFGGNPDSVTLTGVSSGACSVHLHYLSPMSDGLFHKGFSQSGTALNPFAIQDEPLMKAKLLGASLGCPTSSTHALVNCLKQRPFRHILTKVSLFHGYLFTPFSPFGPVIEKGRNAFLHKNPYYLLAKGYIQDLPWLTSNTAHEGLFPAAYIYKDLANVNEKWGEIAPFLLDYNYTLATLLWETTAKKIKKHYLGQNEEINEANFMKLVQMFSDRLFLVDAEYAVRLQGKVNKSPVYYYRFTYPGDHSTNKTVAHGEDAQYFFHNIFNRQPSCNELQMKELLVDMLINFVRTG
ncbi:venom carboxylesterase-6-like [Asbolus verrucosus]|uniref:Carboxylic ester hydrolase n=1 Tax=Asbolus verrucosus TaxID=1661398 RepID=A0A482VK80_ASBVE|nr:venom carboxylesterase-6-like [Asbolus verrucosus]